MPLLSVTLISFLDSTFTCATSCRMALSSHSVMWGTAFSSIPAASLMRRSASRSAFVMELATLVFYTLFIYVVGMRLHMPVAICFMTEVVYYTGLLVASVIYLKKASWQNKKI